jgi:hypothetical protein
MAVSRVTEGLLVNQKLAQKSFPFYSSGMIGMGKKEVNSVKI